MASTHIGDISFGVAAYTDKLQKAEKQINAFGKVVIATANKQAKGYQTVVKALTAQEVAMRKAHQATKVLGDAVLKSKLSEEQQSAVLKQLTSQLNTYVGVLGKVKSTTHDVALSQQSFNAALSASKKGFHELDQAAKKAQSMGGLAVMMKNLESASVLAVGPLSGIGARIRSLGAIMGRTASIGMIAFIAGITAAVVAIWKMSAAAVNASRIFEESMARFKAATGTMGLARAEMNFVIKTSLELGLRLEDTAKAYSRLSAAAMGTKLQGEGIRKVFLGVAKAAAALRLGQGEVEGAFRAIEQMMSKGSVQAEELRGQLGERLPGAFRIAAESMGYTTAEMGKVLKAGGVISEEFLPKFAAQLEKTLGGDAKDNVNSFTGSMNNLATRTLLFAQEWDKVTGTSSAFIGAIKLADKTIQFFTESLRTFIKVIGTAAAAVTGFYIKAIGSAFVSAFVMARKAILGAALAVQIFTAALMMNPITGLVTVVWQIVAALAAAALAWGVLSWALDDNADALDDAAEAERKLDEAARQTLITAGEEADAFDKLTKVIRQAAGSLEDWERASDMGKNAKEIQMFFDAFSEQTKLRLTGVGLKELQTKSDALTDAMGIAKKVWTDVGEAIEWVGSNTYRLIASEQLRQDQVSTGIALEDKLADAIFEASVARERLKAASESTEDLKYFDEVTAKVKEYERSLIDTGKSELERAQAARELREALALIWAINTQITEQEKERKKALKAETKSVEMLRKAEVKLADQRERLVAAQQGEEALEYYDKVTKAVNKYRDAIFAANLTDQERIDKLAEYERVLAQLLAAENAITDARKASVAATRLQLKVEADLARAQKKAADALDKADFKLEEMRKSLAALRAGPESFEVFNEVTKKVDAFRRSLELAKVPMADINARVAEFQRLLEEERAFKVFADLANDMANSVGNSLEGLLNGTVSLKDSFKSLAQELWNLMLRALIIDPIMKSLSNTITGFMSGGAGGGGGGGGGGGFLGGLMSIGSSFLGGGGGSSGGGNPGGAGGFGNLGMAKGGYAQAGSTHLVGEEGPEILRMGARGGTVIPFDKMEREVTNADQKHQTNNIVVNLPPAVARLSAQQIAGEVGRVQRRAMGRNR